MVYGDKRDYRKIDIYKRDALTGRYAYICSTTWARSCREAMARYCQLVFGEGVTS
jgi:hypothetical protein